MTDIEAGERPLAFVGIGSNLGDPAARIDAAVRRLSATPGCHVFATSSLYRSAPFGPVEQPDFLNAVIALTTALTAHELLQALLAIEDAMGRERLVHWGPRVIDLDLLVFGNAVIRGPDLEVPHPGIAERNFVLLPLAEIAPDLVIPGLGPVSDIAVSMTEPRIERVADRNLAIESTAGR